MKKLIIISLAVSLFLQAHSAQARDASQAGAIGGAASGALLGQAIGHDTEATLIGTAVGGVLGYMIGNEMDKNRGIRIINTAPPQRVVVHHYNAPPPARFIHRAQPRRHYRSAHHRPAAYRHAYRHGNHDRFGAPRCEKTIIIR